jgi:hypothetical protein
MRVDFQHVRNRGSILVAGRATATPRGQEDISIGPHAKPDENSPFRRSLRVSPSTSAGQEFCDNTVRSLGAP